MDRTTRGPGKRGLLERLGLRRASKAESEARKAGEQSLRIVNPYHAVSITPCLMACDEVRKYLGKRYLSREAPKVPVAGCTNRQCRCRYQHHDDRRSDERRVRNDRAAGLPSYLGPERRVLRRGRRATD